MAFIAQVCGIGKFHRIDHAGPADRFTLAGSYGPRVGGAFDRVGAFHLAEEREHHHRQLRHRVLWIRRINPDRVSEIAHPHTAVGQIVDERFTVSRAVRPSRSRVWTTMTSPPRAWPRAS